MKILMTSDTYLPRLGGGEYHVYYLARELRRMGHTVTLVTAEQGTSVHGDEQFVVRVAYKGWRSFVAIFRTLWGLTKGVDVVHSHYSYRLAFIAGTVARLQSKRFVVTQHGLGLLPQAGVRGLNAFVFKIWRRWSMVCAHCVISTSDDLSTDIRALGFEQKIVHIPNGYDPEVFRVLPEPSNTAPVVVAVRRLVPKTGLQYLIAAVPELKKQFPGIRVELVGDGMYKPVLEELVDRLQVRDIVHFNGPVNHERLLDFYAKADLVVIPSTAESTSLTCIEAMALGKSIVASRVGGLIELLGKGQERGYLVAITPTEHCDYDAPSVLPPEKQRLLIDTITHALRNPSEAKHKAKAAAKYAEEKFAWPTIADRTVLFAFAKPLVRKRV